MFAVDPAATCLVSLQYSLRDERKMTHKELSPANTVSAMSLEFELMVLTCIDRESVRVSGSGLEICSGLRSQDLGECHQRGCHGQKGTYSYKAKGVPGLCEQMPLSGWRTKNLNRTRTVHHLVTV